MHYFVNLARLYEPLAKHEKNIVYAAKSLSSSHRESFRGGGLAPSRKAVAYEPIAARLYSRRAILTYFASVAIHTHRVITNERARWSHRFSLLRAMNMHEYTFSPVTLAAASLVRALMLMRAFARYFSTK